MWRGYRCPRLISQFSAGILLSRISIIFEHQVYQPLESGTLLSAHRKEQMRGASGDLRHYETMDYKQGPVPGYTRFTALSMLWLKGLMPKRNIRAMDETGLRYTWKKCPDDRLIFGRTACEKSEGLCA